MNRQLCIILLAALFIRLIYFFSILIVNPSGFIEYDSGLYLHLAKNITNNFSFSPQEQPPFIPDPYHTPLYPLFLAGVIGAGNAIGMPMAEAEGGGIFLIIIIQILLSVLSCGLVWLICRRITNEFLSAIIASSVMALDIPSVVFANSVMTETLFVFLFTASVYFYFKFFFGIKKMQHLILSALLLGFAILTRPIALYIPVIFLSGFFILIPPGQGIKCMRLLHAGKTALIFLGMALLTIAPWYARNYDSFGHLFFSLIGKVNLCNFHAAAIKGETEQKNFYAAREELWAQLSDSYNNDMRKDIVKYSNYIGGESVKIILKHPFLFIKNHFKGIIHLLFKPVRGDVDRQLGAHTTFNSITPVDSFFDAGIFKKLFSESGPVASSLVIFQWLLMAVVYLGLLKGWFVLYRNKHWFLLIFLSGIILYFINITLPPMTYARFRVPLMPVIAMVSGIGINSFFKKILK